MSKGYWAGDAIAQGITNVGLASEYERAVDDRIALRKRMEAEYESVSVELHPASTRLMLT